MNSGFPIMTSLTKPEPCETPARPVPPRTNSVSAKPDCAKPDCTKLQLTKPQLTESERAEPARTRTEALRLQLADEIVTGLLEPGESLDEQELARRFGVSRTPVREAIRQLAAAGLVETRPHRGALVALPSPRELDEMFRAMAELEALCAGLSAIQMSPSQRSALEAMHLRMGVLMREGDVERYHAANAAFHTAIYDGSANSYLADIARKTRIRVTPFRRAQFRARGRLVRSHEEHAVVVQAILRGDRARATEAMRGHIDTLWDAKRKRLRETR